RLRLELLASRPIIAAYEDGKAERERQLQAAVQAIDFSPLDKGDQAAFDASLKSAHAKLEVLKPWLQQFTIRAVGNSHIDMAWLWPWTETVEVVRNTFNSVLDLMREYPTSSSQCLRRGPMNGCKRSIRISIIRSSSA